MKVKHVIVDGSNIATEGRDAPSLAQLDEAVQAFIEEYSPDYVTVVVDATFPNRIDQKERRTYEDAVNANELVTPPAGAIGRGDAFILQIARRADAAILSNDSFQEFHGEYPWLFDKGRLIGGKPVPHVGWVFMDRAPVRGPTSRRAVSEARKVAKAAEKTTKRTTRGAAAAASKTTRARRSRAKAEPDETPPTPAAAAVDDETMQAVIAEATGDGGAAGSGRSSKGVEPYNEALPFIEFVAQHPVGSEVDAIIERFSSHGAYVMVGAARAYVPLRNLADPAPRSAKEVLRVGDEQQFVVVSIDPPRRGIDLAVPGVVEVPEPATPPEAEQAVPAKAAGKRTRTRAAAAPADGEPAPGGAGEAESTPAAGGQTPRKAAEKPSTAKKAAKRTAAKKAPGETAAKKKASKKAPAEKAAKRS
ncbi:MAG: S1 RNA-binding domain-containing protein, partial [Acidimicrobiales bacterium]|nr:S1 RNA-binding domain-containing protein [Acidimicrobiales bacterium]